jgi:YfaZ precursor
MRKQLAAFALVLLMAGTAHATSFDLSFDNDSAQVGLTQPLVADELGASRFGARLLYNGDENTRLLSAGVEFVGEPGNVPGLEIGVGVQGYGGRTDQGQDILAAAVGGVASYTPPALGGVVFGAKLYVAPKIFSGLDSDGLLETAVRVGYRVTPKIEVYLGYQNIRSDFGRLDTWTIDEAVRLGFAATF